MSERAWDLKALASEVVALAKKKGAAAAEAFLEVASGCYIEVRNREVEKLRLSREQGVGLRVLLGERLGFAYTTSFGREAREEIVRRALEAAKEATPDRFNFFPLPGEAYPTLSLADPEIVGTPLAEKITFAKRVEEAGRAFDPRVKVTESCVYEDESVTVCLASSEGILESYTANSCALYAFLVASEGESAETGFGFQFSLRFRELDPEKVGKEAAAKAVQMLGARSVATQKVPLILDPYVAANFLGMVAAALSADAVQKGKSLFREKLGKKVASSLVTVVDDGLLPYGLGSAPFDGEGVPTRRTVCLEEGELKGYLYNSYTAAKDGVASTGNAVRGSFRDLPAVGVTNFFLAPGKEPPAALFKDVSQGFYVTEVMGMHTANPISGDFSVGAAGVWIVDGELAFPVRGVVVAGNILGFLEAVEGVGNDLTFFGKIGAPTLRIGALTVSGA